MILPPRSSRAAMTGAGILAAPAAVATAAGLMRGSAAGRAHVVAVVASPAETPR